MTIEVHGQFIVHAQDSYAFGDDVGFSFADPGSVLTSLGRIDVRFTTSAGPQVGVLGEAGHGAATLRMGGGAMLTVESEATQGAAYGVDLQADGSRLINHGVIEVQSAADAIGVGLTGFHMRASNHNDIGATAAGDATGVLISGSASLRNTGSIKAFGEAGATGVEIAGLGAIIVNRGAIGAFDAPDAAAIRIEADQPSSSIIINRGAISAETSVLIEGDHRTILVLNNYGAIYGDMRLSDGAEVFNHGLIVGNIDLGDGFGLFTNDHLQRVGGVVMGGGGRDMLVGDKTAEVFYGDHQAAEAGDGHDILRGGGGDDQLFGGGGRDLVWGGRGGDMLSGGSGSDTFYYAALGESRAGHGDLITDLQNRDRIDLSSIDADTTLAGDQGFVRVARLDGHAGELTLGYDATADRTVLKADVDGDGKADMVVLIDGDHLGFTGLIL